MFENPLFCVTFCAMILNNPMFAVFNDTPLQNQMHSKTPCLAIVKCKDIWNPRVLLCVQRNGSEICSVQPFFGQVLFKNPDGRFHAVRTAPDVVPHAVRKAMRCATCIGTPAFTSGAYSNCCWVGAGLWRKTHGKSGSTAPLFQTPRHCLWTQESKCTAMLKLDASWPCVWGTAQLSVLTLWWCWQNRSHCNLSQSKPRNRTAICGNFQFGLLGPWLQRQGSKTRGFWQNNWGQFWVRSRASRQQIFQTATIQQRMM